MKQFFRGAVRITESDGFFTPHRFTEAQEAHYASISEGALIRARCSSSVSLAFTTSAGVISFDYRADAFSRAFVGFDVYENGILTRHFDEPDRSEAGHIVYECRSEGKHEIEIYLSCLNEISVGNADFGSDAQPLPAYRPKLLFIGDSITQGMTAKCPSLVYPTLYARNCGAELLNHSVGGAKFDKTHLDDMPDFAPDHIFVAYGINDLNQCGDNAVLLENAAQYLERLRQLYPQVGRTVITPIWNAKLAKEPEFAGRFAHYSAELARIAGSFGCQAVDGLKLVPNDPRHLFDGTHPNEQGFGFYALGLLDGKNRV